MRLSNKYGGLQFFAASIPTPMNLVVSNYESSHWGGYLISVDNVDVECVNSGELTYAVTVGSSIRIPLSHPSTIINGTAYAMGTAVSIDMDFVDGGTISVSTSGPEIGGVSTVPAVTINIKAASSTKSYDLSTSSKWANLADGEHTVTLKARASNYGTSNFSNSVTVTKGSAMPVKGDLITLDNKQYRVLKVNGSVAEVLAMYNSTDSQAFDTRGGSNVYANSSLDVYLSQTFYNSLSTSMQNAIVAKTFQQDSWYYGSNSSAIAKYNGTYKTTHNYTLSLMSTTFGTSISRKCYVLSCQDVIDYLEVTTSMGAADTTLTYENVWRMLWNQTTSPESTFLWLRSASYRDSDFAFDVTNDYGDLSCYGVSNTLAIRPAFQIDLSKIEWTPVGG